MKNKLWILAGGTVVLALLFAGLILAFQANREASAPSEAVPAPGGAQTARAAYTVLQRWSSGWAGDAAMVSASASMIRSGDGQGVWSFLVYSRGQGKLALVSVRGSEVVILREQAALYPQKPLDLERWALDSDVVLNRWWQDMGHSLWAQPSAQSLHIRLGNNRQGSPTWLVTVLDDQGNLTEIWEVQADTGERLIKGDIE